MGIHLPGMRRSSFSAKLTSSKSGEVPNGYLAIYVGGERKRFVIPISYLNQPSFQELLSEAEEEFGYDHRMSASLFLAEKMSSYKSLLPSMGASLRTQHALT